MGVGSMEIDKKGVGLRLAKSRKEKNLTLNDVASFLSVSGKTTVNAWEKGRSYPKKHIKELAKLYGIDENYLKFGSLNEYVKQILFDEFKKDTSNVKTWIFEYFRKFYDYNQVVHGFHLDKNGNYISNQDEDLEWLKDYERECFDKFLKDNLDNIVKEIEKNSIGYNDTKIKQLVIRYITILTLKKKSEFMSITKNITYKLNEIDFNDINVHGLEFNNISDVPNRIAKTVEEKKEIFFKLKLSNMIMDFNNEIRNLEKEYSETNINNK